MLITKDKPASSRPGHAARTKDLRLKGSGIYVARLGSCGSSPKARTREPRGPSYGEIASSSSYPLSRMPPPAVAGAWEGAKMRDLIDALGAGAGWRVWREWERRGVWFTTHEVLRI